MINTLWPLSSLAVVTALAAPRGVIAHIATAVARPRTAAHLRDRSDVADSYARSIMNGERLALAESDRLALAAGCADALGRLVDADPAALVWWGRGLAGIGSAPTDPGTVDPLTLAAALQYSLDLAHDELRAAGRGREASDRASIPMGAFLMSGLLDRIAGWGHLDRHRTAGIYALDPGRSGPAPLCPFCGFGVYEQTLMRCDRCATIGEFTRTVPDAPLPTRVAPDLAAGRRRVAEIERRATAGVGGMV